METYTRSGWELEEELKAQLRYESTWQAPGPDSPPIPTKLLQISEILISHSRHGPNDDLSLRIQPKPKVAHFRTSAAVPGRDPSPASRSSRKYSPTGKLSVPAPCQTSRGENACTCRQGVAYSCCSYGKTHRWWTRSGGGAQYVAMWSMVLVVFEGWQDSDGGVGCRRRKRRRRQ